MIIMTSPAEAAVSAVRTTLYSKWFTFLAVRPPRPVSLSLYISLSIFIYIYIYI